MPGPLRGSKLNLGCPLGPAHSIGESLDQNQIHITNISELSIILSLVEMTLDLWMASGKMTSPVKMESSVAPQQEHWLDTPQALSPQTEIQRLGHLGLGRT